MSVNDPIVPIAEELEQSPVYVDPSLESSVPADIAADLESTIAEHDLPLYIVAYPVDHGDIFNGRAEQFLAVVQDETGFDGAFVHVDVDNKLTTYSAGNGEDYWEAATVASDEATPAEDLELFVELVISGEGPARLDEQMYGDESDSAGSSTSLVVVLVLVAAALVAGVWQIARRVGGKSVPPAVRRAFDVPQSVIDAVRTSHESAVAEQARERILALGQALDRTAVPTESDAVTEYQAALDAYDAAARTVDANAEPHLAEAVGAYVLAETGQAHLERATGSARDRKRAMPRPCYFNPLHGTGTRHVALPGNSGSKVPACDDCTQATKAGLAPQALIVTVDGTPMPYYEAGLEPWASSGYGALDSDLANRVLTRGIDR